MEEVFIFILQLVERYSPGWQQVVAVALEFLCTCSCGASGVRGVRGGGRDVVHTHVLVLVVLAGVVVLAMVVLVLVYLLLWSRLVSVV